MTIEDAITKLERIEQKREKPSETKARRIRIVLRELETIMKRDGYVVEDQRSLRGVIQSAMKDDEHHFLSLYSIDEISGGRSEEGYVELEDSYDFGQFTAKLCCKVEEIDKSDRQLFLKIVPSEAR